MSSDARFMLNKMRSNSGRKIISVTDARDILTRKYNQKKRQVGKASSMKRITIHNRSSNQSFQRYNNFNKNKGFTSNNYQNNYNNKSNNRQGFSRNITNRRPGFIVKRDRQGLLQKTIRGNVPQNKQVFSDRSGITVVAKVSDVKTNYTAMEDDGDELERMTLADLPDVRLPPGLLSAKTSTQFASPASSSSSLPSISPLNIATNSMIADSISNNQLSNANPCVLVSNLLPSVSEQDIIELFSSVGDLVSVQPLRSGEMLVEYNSFTDALIAVKQFDSISLDRQIMHCSIYPGQEERTLASRLGGKPSNFTPIASSSSATSYNQALPARKNVKFIVQLP